jgi:DNA-directed RNA polymerase sigma subunit (sigma70/sigma32)
MDSDLSLINKIKDENDSQSLMELINRHSGIYMDMVNKTISDSCSFINKNDILKDKDYSIYSAALKYKSDKNTKFPTYLANETRWKCLNIYNKNKKMIEEPLDDQLKEKSSSEDFLFDLQAKESLKNILEIANKNTDPRVKKIIDMRYCFGYNRVCSWREIAKELNMSIQGCIDIHNKFINKVKQEIKNV